jgi:hypothetical protein
MQSFRTGRANRDCALHRAVTRFVSNGSWARRVERQFGYGAERLGALGPEHVRECEELMACLPHLTALGISARDRLWTKVKKMKKTDSKLARVARRLAVALAVALVAGEAAVQVSGVVDVPVYRADSEIGYIPAPNQSGTFLNTHRWRFNEYSMGAGPFFPESGRFNLLLVGDSIVLGGNPLSEQDRLGPQLEKLTGWQVWPASAGSWALQNELTYLHLHPGVLERVDALALVLNSGDFDGPSSWSSGLTHPLSHPFPGLLYLARKHILRSVTLPPAALHVAPRDWRADLRALSGKFGKPVVILLYPSLAEVGDGKALDAALYSRIPDLTANAGQRAMVVRVADSGEWNLSLYRDEIHPTERGNARLADIIRRGVCRLDAARTGCG